MIIWIRGGTEVVNKLNTLHLTWCGQGCEKTCATSVGTRTELEDWNVIAWNSEWRWILKNPGNCWQFWGNWNVAKFFLFSLQNLLVLLIEVEIRRNFMHKCFGVLLAHWVNLSPPNTKIRHEDKLDSYVGHLIMTRNWRLRPWQGYQLSQLIHTLTRCNL